ncbi:putative serine/threonine kinase-like protein [Tribonema minus]|uniref:Putative serine/threonine kinase-like protein n=1 Tax=Tribonema minus TaxID=303371 RepID=A0A836CIG8_9STRA|nr:putative serine/threonine kinase-like protein [Tribonema minus]
MNRQESRDTCKIKPGDIIDRYRILKLLGTGASGQVFLVDDSGKQFAMKVVRLPDMHKTKTYTRLKREVEIMKRLDNERIVKLYRVLKGSTCIYLICEYVAGGDLFDKIALNNQLTETEARRYFRQIVEGMVYCHSQNISHRDIKPENIMITSCDDVKIADFGLSRIKTQTTVVFDTFCGTLNYVAPELLAKRPYDSKCDIWSLGIMLYVMLSGRFPYDSDDDEETAHMILDDQFTFPASIVDGNAKNLISQMLQKRPESRPTMIQVAAHQWLL